MRNLDLRTLLTVFASALVFGCSPVALDTEPTEAVEEDEVDEEDDDVDPVDDDDAGEEPMSDDDDASDDPVDDDDVGEEPADDDDSQGDEWPDLPGDDDDDDDEPDPEPEPSGLCAPGMNLACGLQVAADTTAAGATSEIDGYSCSPWDASGPEVAYQLVAAETGPITVELVEMQAGQDLDIYVVADAAGACASDQCVAYGNSVTTFDAVAGETWYVVIDGYNGSAGGFVLEVVCGDEEVAGDDDDAVGDDDDDTPEPDPEPDPEPQQPGVCVPLYPVEADTVVPTNNAGPGSTNAIDSYSCVGWDETGPEIAWSFVAEADGQVTAHIELVADELIELVFGPQEDLDLFVLDASSCSGDSCIAFGDDTVSWSVSAGELTYLVIDGAGGDSSPFELTLSFVPTAPTEPEPEPEELDCTDGLDDDADGLVDCEDDDCSGESVCLEEAVCIPARIVGCGETDHWNNGAFGSWNLLDSYGCVGWNESGPEVTYLFEAPTDAEVTVELSGMSADLDLFVVGRTDDACDATTCLAHGNVSATVDVAGGETIHFVVDGFNGAVSDYDLSVTCQ